MPAPAPIQSTTQEHLDINDIADDLILLKDGSVAMIIATSAVNFGLLSESEQDATIYAYAALLNSLTFPIQIFIRSNQKDITAYEKLLVEQESKSAKPENKDRIRKYREFIAETVRQRNVLDKKFYLIVPFSVLELGIAKSAVVVAKGSSRTLPFPKEYILGRAKITLEPKRDHLIHQLLRLGLKSRQLTTKELIQLLFEIYNPDSAQGQILTGPEEYETPIVQPAVAFKEAPQALSSSQHSSQNSKVEFSQNQNINSQPPGQQITNPSQENKAQAASPPLPETQTSEPPVITNNPQDIIDQALKND